MVGNRKRKPVAVALLGSALFLGGVAHRFPSLRFAFLEGGAGWAAMLYADLLAHWRKRNIQATAFGSKSVTPNSFTSRMAPSIGRCRC